jgi:integrase
VVPLRALPGMRAQDCRVPRNWQKHWRDLRRAAGFTRWTPDVCRHSFASYHAAYFRNLPELQVIMGHRDLSLLRSRYMAPTSRKEARVFWGKQG